MNSQGGKDRWSAPCNGGCVPCNRYIAVTNGILLHARHRKWIGVQAEKRRSIHFIGCYRKFIIQLHHTHGTTNHEAGVRWHIGRLHAQSCRKVFKLAYPEHNRISYLPNIAFTVLCFWLLAGCASKRDSYDVPVLDLPAQYAKAPAVSGIADSGNASTQVSAPLPVSEPPLSEALAEWWRLLGSQELNALMDRALANNPDLRIATLRIAQSKARLDQAGADKVPVITMPAQSKIEYPTFGIGSGSASGDNNSRTTHQISLRGDWRPDIWGEMHSLYESSELQLLRATYQRDDMQRNVVANVAANYMEYLSLNDRLRVSIETEKSLAEMLASVNARLGAGDATITEVEQQKAAVYSARATIPVLEQQREVVLNRLASLVGSVPVALNLSDSGLNSIEFPQTFPGVPSALLLHRPDVRAVEARLLAADADIDVARARVLPPLDLTAQIGYGSNYMSKLFKPQALFWNTIANLSVTIFDSGKRSKEVEFARAVHEELLETYVRVIYDAVREVDDSLSAISLMGKRLEAQGVAADSSLRAWNFSQDSFMAGAVDYLVVLDTQRTYQRNLDDWYNVRMERYRSLTNLFSALGGGVSGGDVMPGRGARPVPPTDRAGAREIDAISPGRDSRTGIDKAILSGRAQAKRVDWTGSSLRSGANHWLVELSGVYDRGAVLSAWRDLHARFPQSIYGRILLPQRQGQVNAAGIERASWYRLFDAVFANKRMAEEFCATLHAGQQRCSVVPSQTISGKDGFAAPSNPGQPESAVAGAGMAVKRADMPQPKGQQEARTLAEKPAAVRQATEAEAVRAQTEQDAKASNETETTLLKAAQKTEAQTGKHAAAEVKAEAAQIPASSPEILVESWVKDWTEKNVEGYLSHYDTGFRPADGKDRQSWEVKRRSRIGEATSIKVRAENLKIEQQDELTATARFAETIEVGGYKKISRKRLLLVRGSSDGEWKIREEREETKAEAARARAEQKTKIQAGKRVAAKVEQAERDQKTDEAAMPIKGQLDGLDWSGQQFWLVEMSDALDRDAVTAAWRNLRARFPELMGTRTILTRRQDRVSGTGEEHAYRYQLFIAKFPEKQMAENFCATLRAGEQRCGAVSSQLLAGKSGLNAISVTGEGDSGQNTKGVQP